MNKKFDSKKLGWGNGESTLFLLYSENGTWEVLDYEYDYERIHEECGGRCYYISRSGNSGSGFIKKFGRLIPVGYYRVDTVYNEHHSPIEVGEDIKLMLPYVTHEERKEETLYNYPVVIMQGCRTIIYVGFYTNMNEVLDLLLRGEDLIQEPQILRRSFVNPEDLWERQKDEEINFFNLFGERSYNPWEFATELLEDYIVYPSDDRIHRIFHIAKSKSGKFVSISRIANTYYAREFLEEDPCEKVTHPFYGWEIEEPNLLYKLQEKQVYIVGWKDRATEYMRKTDQVARFLTEEEAKGFKKRIKALLENEPRYVEYELEIPKMRFFMKEKEDCKAVWKGISSKVRSEVFCELKYFLSDFNTQKVLEVIPDEMVIKKEDSWNAGNCIPGTEEFANRCFPGKLEITAKQLKRYAGNRNVMRVLKYIAEREGFLEKG